MMNWNVYSPRAEQPAVKSLEHTGAWNKRTEKNGAAAELKTVSRECSLPQSEHAFIHIDAIQFFRASNRSPISWVAVDNKRICSEIFNSLLSNGHPVAKDRDKEEEEEEEKNK